MSKRTVLPDSRITPRFAGATTFGRYPRLEDVAPEQAPVDWAIYGVPFDGGVTYRPGARFGPRAVRDASAYLKRFHMAHNLDVCDALSLADAGDAPVAPFSIPETLDRAADFALSMPDDARLLALGGDHSISYANIRATYQRLGEPAGGLALVHFDSHLDTVDSVWDERYSHASPFRRVIEEGFVNPARMLTIGVKGPLNRGDDLAFARSAGVTLVGRDQLAAEGPRAVDGFVRRLLDERGTTGAGVPTYITFDVDVADPAFAPGTGTPCPGGITTTEAFELLRRLAGLRVVGGDVVEVLPDRDVSAITALFAAHVAFEIIALDACHRRAHG